MQLFPETFRWQSYFAAARICLGLIVIGQELTVRAHPLPLYTVTIWIFIVYGLLLFLRIKTLGGIFGLLALFADSVFFLIIASQSLPSTIWLTAVFFTFLVSEAVAFYGFKEVIMIAVVCSAFCAVAPNPQFRPLLGTMLALATVGSAFAVYKQRSAMRITALEENLAEARTRAVQGREEERQRIANDFHDGPLQNFISFQMRLEILRKLLDRDRNAGMQELQALQEVAISQVRELRAFIRSMRPMDVEGANLSASIRRIAETFQKESGIPVTFVGGETAVSLPPEANQELLQMVREALHNIQKHAHASRVAVAIEKTGKTLEISVDDNGNGFAFSGVYSLDELDMLRLGPVSLKRRARLLNAEMILESRPGRGAGLKLKVPL